MPVVVYEQSLSAETPVYFAKVTKEDPQIATALQQACSSPDQFLLYEAHFNGQPVGFSLINRNQHQLETIIIHPATRQRGVGKVLLEETLKQYGEPVQLPAHCDQKQ